MNALKFTLSGKTAFFKKPDVNTYYYFTYGNIHKIALLGILGAVSGYGGYNEQEFNRKGNGKKGAYPEFYEKLKDIKIGIVPQNDKGYIPKKVQVFNNSVGYASKEQGGNLIVKEQWLEEPKWDIYILIQGEVEKELSDRLMNLSFEYIPYLGKNDHLANITDIEIIEDVEKADNVNKMDSLFIKDYFEFVEFKDDIFGSGEYVPIYKYQEMLPISLEETTNKYNLETFIYTNSQLKCLKDALLYKCNEGLIFFF
ncbi:type I-B CRISPR-associated protein Cas5b [Clostridium brassicae]|uniref:Type I-B CRISPR-associated protein Cas5b n=1 Tax=Clostridium brassicae TaxID=2999072 RepID=A0ABT4D7S8_9CLOT|nr:type I-B CRISPR-associated protein Cas5b [Clostridium brassicae]MCY6958357.1 type I-B CRISPR-associated protein Cas5b [Clostridium brassicae]